MRILFLVRSGMLARNPYKLKRLREEADRLGHSLLHLDFADIDIVCRSGGCEVLAHGRDFPRVDLVYWAFGWDDREAWDISKAVEEAGHRMYLSTAAPLSDKVSQAFLLAKAGVAIPDTRVASLGMLRGRWDGVSFPQVMKGRYGARGDMVAWVDNPSDIERTAKALGLPDNQPFVLQEPVMPLGQDVRAFVIGDTVVAAMLRTAAQGDFRANFSAGGSVAPTQLDGAEHDAVLRASRAFGAPHAGVDFIRSERGPVILEVNMWPGLEGIEKATGLNIAALLVEDMARLACLKP